MRTLVAWERQQRTPPVRFVPRIIRFLGYCPWRVAASPGDRFRQVRVALGLTHKAAAALLGVDPATLSHWETGERRPPAGTRERLLR